MNRIIESNANIWANRRVEDPKLGITYTFSEPALTTYTEQIVRKCISEVAMMGVVQYENEDIAWAVDMIIGNLKETFEIRNMATRNLGTSEAPESFGRKRRV